MPDDSFKMPKPPRPGTKRAKLVELIKGGASTREVSEALGVSLNSAAGMMSRERVFMAAREGDPEALRRVEADREMRRPLSKAAYQKAMQDPEKKAQHRAYHREKTRERRRTNPDRARQRAREYYYRDVERQRALNRERTRRWWEKLGDDDRERVNEGHRQRSRQEEVKERKRARYHEKMRNDPEWAERERARNRPRAVAYMTRRLLTEDAVRLHYNISRRLHLQMRRGGRAPDQTVEFVGTDGRELLEHNGLDGKPEGFVLDHIVPCACFDWDDEDQLRCMWWWPNLRFIDAGTNAGRKNDPSDPLGRLGNASTWARETRELLRPHIEQAARVHARLRLLWPRLDPRWRNFYAQLVDRLERVVAEHEGESRADATD